MKSIQSKTQGEVLDLEEFEQARVIVEKIKSLKDIKESMKDKHRLEYHQYKQFIDVLMEEIDLELDNLEMELDKI